MKVVYWIIIILILILLSFFAYAYLKDSSKPMSNNVNSQNLTSKNLSAKTKTFDMPDFGNITFEYPEIEGFELQQKYNSAKQAGEITYYSPQNLIPTGPPGSSVDVHRHPMLIVQKTASESSSADEIKTNPYGIKYKIRDVRKPGTDDSDDPYSNIDATIELDVSGKEIYLISTVNFVYHNMA